MEVDDRALVSALLPVLSLSAGDFPAFFFLMVWPIIGFGGDARLFAELEEQSEDAARASCAWSPSATGWPATCTTCWATR